MYRILTLTLKFVICLRKTAVPIIVSLRNSGCYVCRFPIRLRIKLATKATAKSAIIHTVKLKTPRNARTVKSSRSTMAIMPILFFVLRTASVPELFAAFKPVTLTFDDGYGNQPRHLRRNPDSITDFRNNINVLIRRVSLLSQNRSARSSNHNSALF